MESPLPKVVIPKTLDTTFATISLMDSPEYQGKPLQKGHPTYMNRLENVVRNASERVAGLTEWGRYTKAAENVTNVFRDRIQDHPTLALTLDLEGQKGKQDESCVLYWNPTVEQIIYLKKGDRSVELQFDTQSRRLRVISEGGFPTGFKRMLKQVERQLPHTEIQDSPEMKAARQIEESCQILKERFQADPDTYKPKKYMEDEKRAKSEGKIPLDKYSVSGEFSDTVPLFGWPSYIDQYNIESVIDNLSKDDSLILESEGPGPSDVYNARSHFFLSNWPDGSTHVHFSIWDRYDNKRSYEVTLDKNGKLAGAEVYDNPDRPFTPKRVSSRDGSYVVSEINRVLSAFVEDPFYPNAAILPEKGYVRLDEEGKVIQITPGVFTQIDEELISAPDKIKSAYQLQKYTESLNKLKDVLLAKIKARKIPLIGNDGEVIAIPDNAGEMSLEELLAHQEGLKRKNS